jgi:membrane protease YdiL (CAAX protease family)
MSAAQQVDTGRRNLYAACIAAGTFPYLINGYINARIASSPALYWTFELLCWLAVPAVVLVVLVRRAGLRFSEIGLNGRIFGRYSVGLVILMCLVMCLLCAWVYHLALGLSRALLPDNPLFEYQSIVPQSGAAHTLAALYLALSAGIVEEIYFRGLLHKLAGWAARPVPAYLTLSPLLFASIHWETGWAGTAAAYVFGLFTALAFLLTRNLWPLIAGHFYTDYSLYG